MRVIIPFLLLFFSFFVSASNEYNFKQVKDCSSEKKITLRKLINYNNLLIVSTLDGMIAALDEDNKGTLIWSLLTNSDGLLSSTLNDVKVINNAISYKVVPSFDGTLYKLFESSKILEPIPINADILLKNSFKLGDDLINGGKEIRTFAIDIDTGELIYSCNFDNCSNLSRKENISALNILLVHQNRQKVRAVNPENGSEQWKFSVAENILYLLSEAEDCHIFDENINQQCKNEKEESLSFNVANGIIRAHNFKKKEILWSYQFSSPIVNVWRYKNGKIIPLDLFNQKPTSMTSNKLKEKNRKPSLYLGSHNNQFYIQNLDKEKLNPFGLNSISLNYQKVPQYNLQPSTSNELQVISSHNAISQIFNYGMFVYKDEELDSLSSQEENLSNDSFNDLYNTNLSSKDTIDQIIIISLWHWWKEVLIISITISILINASFAYIKGKISTHFPFYHALSVSKAEPNEIKLSSSLNNLSLFNEVINKSHSQATSDSSSDRYSFFNSRYFNDFEVLSCLGKGGFGVVFEVRNKIDDCKYAIKRINLPLNKNSRDKVMREVKALAKLDHQNIVRYYNSWLEVYPSDWKETNQNNILENKFLITSHAKASTSLTSQKFVRSLSSSLNLNSKLDDSKILNNCENLLTDSYIVFQNETDKAVCDKKRDPDSFSKPSAEEIKSKSNLNTFLYIQMQLCQRQTLREWLKTNYDRNKTEICDIFIQIVNAVEYVHSMGLIHRDLKPSNIFFSLDNCVKVGDFGLVTEFSINSLVHSPGGDEIFKSGENDASLTNNVGTKLYISPEQMTSSLYSNKVDIFALGVIFFEMLIPFKTEMERIKVLSKIRKRKFPEDIQASNPKECAFTSKLLSENPDERPLAQEILKHSLFDGLELEELCTDSRSKQRQRTFSASKT